MADVEMLMPRMGESVMEGTVLKWLKSEGDAVEEDESVLEVATDKVDTEIPCPYTGTLKKILAKEGDVIPIDQPIAVITTEAAEAEETQEASPSPAAAEQEKESTESTTKEHVSAGSETSESKAEETHPQSGTQTSSSAGAAESLLLDEPVKNRFYSPLVKNIAREENISNDELERIPGSGKNQRVTKKDILNYVAQRKEGAGSGAAASAADAGDTEVGVASAGSSYSGETEIMEMDRMRKMIADRMVESKRISAHVTSFVEADVTPIVNWRNKVKKELYEKEGVTLTFTPIFIEAVVKALKDYPLVNASVDGSNVIIKKNINIGVAVAQPSGNLIVPVIHHADYLNLVGIARKMNDLAKRARENNLKADELQGGTFTVSNVGSFGNEMGTPIIMQPQVAILALGAVNKKPSVIETPQGDTIGIRHKMFLSHSYDHRIIDGALGGSFVKRVADYLEAFDENRHLY